PAIGAVGAKLLYENGTVQHGGIIIGLAGLAEHANRGLPRGAPGYAHRAVLSQEVSAVTGACLLTRRSAYLEVGGLDEGFPIAFNDVDFCLRLREAGHGIVFCAEAELIHYESLSLGHHFSGERAALEREEVRRMRRRWSAAVAADPFHNPNLSLTRGQEWQSAFPSRARRSVWVGDLSSSGTTGR
ncbi:MAG: glycosyltransferase, partial [Acetobacteraceae bacterium]